MIEPVVSDVDGTMCPGDAVRSSLEPFGQRGAFPVVGASEQFDILVECERDVQGNLGWRARAHQSQPYSLDVTNPTADKSTAVHAFAMWYEVDVADFRVLCDQRNDVPMSRVAGRGIAMANAPARVAAEARQRTASNEEDGWAAATDRRVLPRAA